MLSNHTDIHIVENTRESMRAQMNKRLIISMQRERVTPGEIYTYTHCCVDIGKSVNGLYELMYVRYVRSGASTSREIKETEAVCGCV